MAGCGFPYLAGRHRPARSPLHGATGRPCLPAPEPPACGRGQAFEFSGFVLQVSELPALEPDQVTEMSPHAFVWRALESLRQAVDVHAQLCGLVPQLGQPRSGGRRAGTQVLSGSVRPGRVRAVSRRCVPCVVAVSRRHAGVRC